MEEASCAGGSPEEAVGPVMAVDIEQWAGWAYSG
jgi:hypothetical protein